MAAQAERRGIWENLPPAPQTISHPTVMNAAVLTAAGKSYPLDGLDCLGQPYVSQLPGYIAAHGDRLISSAQGHTSYSICLLGDSTDIAKVARVNVAAQVGTDALDSYRLQQAEASNNHHNYWLKATPEILQLATSFQPDMYAIMPEDNGDDGISCVSVTPLAGIGGESVTPVYGEGVGWGHYDHYHHWRGASGPYRARMEHFHPAAHGLRGYRHDGGFRRETAFPRRGHAAPRGICTRQRQPCMRRLTPPAHHHRGSITKPACSSLSRTAPGYSADRSSHRTP